uniref:Thioredoxin domain-containing protein n=1 Tax=Strigamia maritima TaxID=126957 RepID=T1ITU5_STRMM
MDLLAGKKLQRKKEKELVDIESAEALKGVEIVEMREFIQSCHGEWLAVPFDQEVLSLSLNEMALTFLDVNNFVGKYGVECIPELIIFKGSQLVTKEGRWDIELKKGQCFDSWKSGKRATTEDEVNKFVEVEDDAPISLQGIPAVK